jgi:hypothetical protein
MVRRKLSRSGNSLSREILASATLKSRFDFSTLTDPGDVTAYFHPLFSRFFSIHYGGMVSVKGQTRSHPNSSLAPGVFWL